MSPGRRQRSQEQDYHGDHGRLHAAGFTNIALGDPSTRRVSHEVQLRVRQLGAGIPGDCRASGQELGKNGAIDKDLLGGVEDGAPSRNADELRRESGLRYLLVQSRKLSAAEFCESDARTDLTFVHLWEEPAKYRGQLITLRGRLRRLVRYDPTPLAAKEGVPDLYEGWLYADGNYSNPFCILASEIGPGLQPGQKIDREVTFSGYFFKKYRYPAGDGWRDAPLLIGRSIELTKEASEPVPALLGSVYLPVIFGILGVTLVVALGVAWRLRTSDRKVRERLQKLRANQNGRTGF